MMETMSLMGLTVRKVQMHEESNRHGGSADAV